MDNGKACDLQTLPEQTQQIRLEVRLVHPAAYLPYKKRPTDAGYDIYSIEDIDLVPHQATIVRTGIEISAPPGYYYTIEGRSSLWSKGIFPNRGIIDSTFCDEIVVSLVNVNDSVYRILSGDRIAQIIIHKQYDADFQIVENFSQLYNQRGKDGFGSSGR